jgi:hypothetical protein
MPKDANVRVLGLIVPIKNAGLQAGEDGEPDLQLYSTLDQE